MSSSAVIALARTGVPYVVAWLLSLPAAPAIEHALGVTAAGARSELTGALVAAAGSVYYAGVRWAERRWPAAGWLLGVAAPPVYPSRPARRHGSAADGAAATGAHLIDDEDER